SWFGSSLGSWLRSRLGSSFGSGPGGRFSGGLGSCRSSRLGCRLDFGLGDWLDRLTGELLDLLGQAVDLGLQRLHFVAARYAQTGDGAVKTLVESLFQLAPLADGLAFDFVDFRLGRTDGAANAGLDHIQLLVDFGLGFLLGL